jgi:hypothetical protein
MQIISFIAILIIFILIMGILLQMLGIDLSKSMYILRIKIWLEDIFKIGS